MSLWAVAHRWLLTSALLVSAWGLVSPVDAVAAPRELPDSTAPQPKRLIGIDVTEHLERDLPKELEFTDETGKRVRLGDFFDGERPVVITLNYSNCPMLCSLQLNGFVTGLRGMDWRVGDEFRVITISLDPDETPSQALKTKQRYLKELGAGDVGSGWSFLTGSEANIRALADAIGFQYGYNEVRQEYVHPAAITLTTPQGKIARYLYGIEYHPKTLRLGLVESSEGKIGSTVDRLILFCFHYDSSEGRYAPVAMKIMQVAGGTTAFVLGGVLTSLWAAEARRRKKKGAKAHPAGDDSSPSDQES